jgi:hypothetical protein
VLITLQITREYQQAEGFGDVAKKIRGMIPSLEIKITTSSEKEKDAYNVSGALTKNHQ